MVCPDCGAPVENGNRYCSSCGADVLAARYVPAGNVSPQTYTQNPYAAPPPQPMPQYAYPQYQQQANANNAPLSVGQFILTMIVFAIPLVGFIMMLVWAFGGDVNRNRKNYARASLILWLIGIAIGVFCFILAGASIAAIFHSSNSYNYNF